MALRRTRVARAAWGAADRELAGIERIPGAHCYEFFAGPEAFAALADEEPGSFYLTDFLAKAFDALADGGQVTQPLIETFFAKGFGMVADRFGVGWMILAAPKMP